MKTGITTPDVVPQGQEAFDRIRDAGATSTRVIIFWDQVAPSTEPSSWDPSNPSDQNYDWASFDAQIQGAVNSGLTPLVQIFSAPRWAERCNIPTSGISPSGICNPDPDAFAEFSKAAAIRYNGDFGGLPRVRFWEPWNEPNLFLFFEPQYKNGKKVSPILYRNLLNSFADAVKGVNPSNQIVAGGLAPIERPGGLGPLDFARRVMCMKGRANPKPIPGCGNKASFDIWANNPFTTGGPTHKSAGPDDVSLGDLPEMGKLLRAAHSAGKIRTKQKAIPFWVTEFSWDSKPPDPGGLPMGILSRWTSEAMFRAWKAGVSNFFWLSLRDWPRPAGTPFRESFESGLYFRGETLGEDRPKRNLRAFQFPFVAFGKKSGVSIWGRTPTSASGRVILRYKAKGAWKQLAVVSADSNGIFSSLIKTKVARGLSKRSSADVRAVFKGGSSLPFSLRPVKDFRQPPFGR
ncbi:MAG: hypothetical protein JJE13_04475 [Thermoleophilia bacterium]|nr:hypothetical protein [Thermoleophilia bacterium]